MALEASADQVVSAAMGRSARAADVQCASALKALASATEKVDSLQNELDQVSGERDELPASSTVDGRGRPSGDCSKLRGIHPNIARDRRPNPEIRGLHISNSATFLRTSPSTGVLRA
jgi:hypothetical protein